MTSRFLKNYISILLFSLSLISCGPYYVDGKMIDLEEAYKKSLITKNDLLNIAFYVNGEKNLNQEEYELQELDYSLLDKSIQDSIKFSASKFLFTAIARTLPVRYIPKYAHKNKIKIKKLLFFRSKIAKTSNFLHAKNYLIS